MNKKSPAAPVQRPTTNRRRFLKYAATAATVMAAGPLISWAGRDDKPAARRVRPRPPRRPRPHKWEMRTYYFDFSRFDTSSHDLVLVAGKTRTALSVASRGDLKQARAEHPILDFVPDRHITHRVRLRMPADAVQLCYVQRIRHGNRDGSWDMAFMFYHHPAYALRDAFRRRRRTQRRRSARRLLAVPVKWQRYGITPDLRERLNDPVGEALLQDSNDQATALVAGHPELACGEPSSAAHIQTNIIGSQPETELLGAVIDQQGPATSSGGWATQTALINPDTQDYYRNSQGQIQYVPLWSGETGQFAGSAVAGSLDVAKDDPSLGSNVSAIDPTTVPDNDPGAATYGTIWTLQDGAPNIDQSAVNLQGGEALTFQLSDQTPGHGYALQVDDVTGGSGKVTLKGKAKNWFVRYLSMYVRYLDANGNPIPLSSIESEIRDGFENWDLWGLNGQYDAYLSLVSPQFVILGMPVQAGSLELDIPIPQAATSVAFLAGGLGTGGNPFPGTVDPGKSMTIFFNLCAPSIMLSLMAAAGYGTLTRSLEDSENIREVLDVLIPFGSTYLASVSYNNPEMLQDLIPEVAKFMLSSAAGKIDELIAEAIAEGEAIEAVEDAIPIVGAFISAIWAIGVAASLAETSAQVSNSPQTYIEAVNLTHDLSVTIAHDPGDPVGFPATATSYTVTALFDGATTRTIDAQMPGTTVTAPITVTFTGVPAGGQVKVDVGFYSNTHYLVGRGSVGPVANDPTDQSVNITIEELKVPISATTVYTHKEIITLDSGGNHVWQATTQAPTVAVPQGQCGNSSGQLCTLWDITVSTSTASVGYAWQAENASVIGCSGGNGQLSQFANLSVTDTPQSGYLFSAAPPGCGFSDAARIVYDLMGKQNWNFYVDPTNKQYYVRQIRLAAGSTSDYDLPTSNKAFGKLRFRSDALLLHPIGKIVSINATANKMEILDLPHAAVADADAPRAQIRGGVGERPGLMDGPIHAAMSPSGAILILEQNNNRVQAFDLGGNPAPIFVNGTYFFQLKDVATYLDLAVEYTGYMYVLSYTGNSPYVYRLDVYDPDGHWVTRTTGIYADKIAVSYWRDLYSLNYSVLKKPDNTLPPRTEPSVSHWIPSTPPGLALPR